MINEVDMFQLFGELAGIDVHRAVPRALDSYSMLPYLLNPNQPSIRDYNFAQGGPNIQKDYAHNPPCVIAGACTQVPVSKSVCEDNGGVWWGPGATDPSTFGGGLAECWQVNQVQWEHYAPNYAIHRVAQNPQVYSTTRNDQYKLVTNQWQDYDPATNGPQTLYSTEFYQINEDEPTPLLDKAGLDLLPGGLNQEQQRNFDALQAKLTEVLGEQPDCPGDGNGDRVVDELDVQDYTQIANQWGLSSHYDFNVDALTNGLDLDTILSHFGPCPSGTSSQKVKMAARSAAAL